MKYLLQIVLCIGFAFSSCRKKQQPDPPPAGCISMNYDWRNSRLSTSDSAMAINLLQRNSIYGWQYVPDSIGLSMSGGDSLCVIVARSIGGGLPQFEESASFYFTNGVLDSTHTIPSSLNGATIYDPRPKGNILFVRKRYLEVAKHVDGSTCLEAQYGYLNEETYAGVVTQRCWRVRPSGSDYPVAYITDDNFGRVVLYKD